ncbi:MAG: CDP-glycerol glycerophosphotransferase family protein [Puniceicoccales bacterium]|nr:CDP-glycerol glycerophosphotransferase family protein [Puniceicoccales bacterium]
MHDVKEIACKNYQRAVHKKVNNDIIDNSRCNINTINDVFKAKIKYKYGMCVHNGIDHTGRCDPKRNSYGYKYGMQFICNNLIYGQFAVNTPWITACSVFDTLLCNGEYQKERYEALGIKTEVIASGSPRFDKGNKTVNKEVFLENYGLDTNKKTILWLPTHTEATSVVGFLDIMQGLSAHYNIILKAHTHCYLEIKKLPQLISAMAPNIVNINNMESTELLGVADYVFCDYGGSVFTAIYNDKNVLLLNAEDKYAHKFKDSPEVEIRKEIINFYRHEGDKLISALKDEKIWEEQKAIRKRIKDRFFSTYAEPSGKIIADILLKKLEQTAQGEAS